MTRRKLERLERMYEETLGVEAFNRQREAAKRVHPCCSWRRDQGHHPLCHNASKEAAAR